MSVTFAKSDLQNFEELQSREWIETNGLGGWASSTLSGAHTRRYHGLLVAAVKPPAGRSVLISKLDDTIVRGKKRFHLATNQYRSTLSPAGYTYLESFSHNLFPTFDYRVEDILISKTIIAMHGENTTLVLYEVLKADSEFSLHLRPLSAARPYHHLRHADSTPWPASFSEDVLDIASYDGQPEFFIRVPEATFHPDADWFYRFQYLAERQRGYDYEEDLFSHGHFEVALRKGSKLGVIVSTAPPPQRDAFKLFQLEQERRSVLLSKAPRKDDFAATLHLAADQFIVERGLQLKTLIAGYHWFTDWGRDAMISLPGLCLTTKRFDDAKRILLAFTEKISRGMLPNNFADDNSPAGYNSVDGTLWYFVALYKYLRYTDDLSFIEQLLPVLHDILNWHVRGTRFDIFVAPDGLLHAGNPAVQLTWMDAKVGDWVVTPRQGKAVEVNALWYNALKITEHFCGLCNQAEEAEDLAARARVVHERFNEIFWNGEQECLFDCIDGSNRDARIRPNQIFALSLPFPLMSEERALKILRMVEAKLYTPFGLRTLDPQHPNYQGQYAGTQQTRDAAYHQGTAWSWLLGPYMTAIARFEGQAGQNKLRQIVERFKPHFGEAGIGTVSEIFDGNEPFTARGSISQAWGVAELLRAYSEDVTR
ncbi:MAG: glycogen debranching enzyme N-terminal domain-containing protein [Deltaproteobacteria bacterium]|nr:glycogen debranching enzyme N-terminal domain-containing protein [Deltaproteobacteria bacterium]